MRIDLRWWLAVFPLLLSVSASNADVYDLYSILGHEVLGPIDQPIILPITGEVGPISAPQPFDGFQSETKHVYFAASDGTVPNPLDVLGLFGYAISGGPSGVFVNIQNGQVDISNAYRFLFCCISQGTFAHSAGDTTGFPTVTFTIELPDTLFFADVSPITSGIPEPSTWAMLLIGFAGIGFAAFRNGRHGPNVATSV